MSCVAVLKAFVTVKEIIDLMSQRKYLLFAHGFAVCQTIHFWVPAAELALSSQSQMLKS